MIERLDQLTLKDLIGLSCGERSVLIVGDEKPTEAEMLARAAKILAEYKETASPEQAKMDVTEGEELTKLQMKEKCLRICLALCVQERPDMAKEVMLELDVPEEFLSDPEKINKRCRAMLDETEYEIKRIEELNGDRAVKKAKTTDDVRRAWMSEVAYVMSTLKMAIDPATTNAAIYANLVAQANERNKQLAKMPPMMGMFM